MKKQVKNTENIAKKSVLLLSNYGLSAIIAIVAFVIYAQSLSFDFVFHDDDTMIVNNVSTLEKSSLKTAFFTDAWFREKEIELYRPWQSITYILDYRLWGLNPMGYHLHNVLVFCGALVALFYFLQQIRFSKQWAFLLSLFYAAHYLFVHTVCWIPARGDLYLTLFGLLSLQFFLRYFDTYRIRNLLMANGFFLLALFAKETAVVLLPVAVLLHWAGSQFDSGKWRPYIGFWIVLPLISLVFYFWLRNQSIAVSNSISLSGALYNFPVIPESVLKFFFPVSFSVLSNYNTGLTIGGTVLVLFLLGIVIAFYRKPQVYLMIAGFLSFLLTLLPSLFYKPYFSIYLYDYIDHRMFFSGIGLLIFIGALLLAVAQKTVLLPKIFFVLCIISACFSVYYQNTYRDFEHYYENGLRTNPESALVSLNYATMLRNKKNDLAKASEVINKGLTIYPDSVILMQEKATIFFLMQQYDSMYVVAQKILTHNTNHYNSLVYTGIYYQWKGLSDSAMSAYSAAIQVNPNEYYAFYNRAKLFLNLQNYDAVVADLSEVVRLKPTYAPAYSERGNLYGSFGYFDKALSDFNIYVSLRPDEAIGYFYRGQALALMGQKESGCADLAKAAEMGLVEAKNKYSELCR